jgi:tripartite-type tricarboxylate transporter receptor subunit TctC
MTYNGVVAPAGTPRDVLTRLHAEIVKATQDADYKSRFAKLGIEAAASASPEDFAAFVRDDVTKMAKLVRDIGIRPGE